MPKMAASDLYEWYMRALAGEQVEVHADYPQAGRYRLKRGNRWIPCAIWPGETGELVGLIGTAEDQHEIDPLQIWPSAAKNPVPEADYRLAFDTGRWPDDAPERRGLGDNLPTDALEALKVELASEVEIAAEFLAKPIATQEQADMAGPWCDRILEIAKQADAAHDEEKRPILEAGRDIDDRWREVREDSRALVKKLKAHVGVFLRAQKKREPESKPTAGRTGSKVYLRPVKTAKFTNYAKFVEAVRDTDEVRRFMQQIADRAARAGAPLPGMKIVETEKAA
jgi:hypothetical protein